MKKNPTLQVKAYDFFLTFNETDEMWAVVPRPAEILAKALRLCALVGLARYFAGQHERGDVEGRLHLQALVQMAECNRASALVKACHRAQAEAVKQVKSLAERIFALERRAVASDNAEEKKSLLDVAEELKQTRFRLLECIDPATRKVDFYKQLFAGVHVEKRRGLPGEARDYVTKAGLFFDARRVLIEDDSRQEETRVAGPWEEGSMQPNRDGQEGLLLRTKMEIVRDGAVLYEFKTSTVPFNFFDILDDM